MGRVRPNVDKVADGAELIESVNGMERLRNGYAEEGNVIAFFYAARRKSIGTAVDIFKNSP